MIRRVVVVAVVPSALVVFSALLSRKAIVLWSSVLCTRTTVTPSAFLMVLHRLWVPHLLSLCFVQPLPL